MSHLPAVALLAAAVIAIPASAQPVLLRLTPPVGQVTRYRTVTRTWMQLPGMAQADTTQPTMTQSLFTTRTVTAMDGTSRVVTTVMDSSTRDMGPMNGMMPAGDMFRGITTTQHVDPLGRVSSTDVTAPAGANPMVAEAMRRRAGQRPIVLPEGRVGPGDTWTSSDTMDMGAAGGGAGGRVILDLTYKLDRVERQGATQLARITIAGAMHGDSAGVAGAAEGKMTGEIAFDVSAGRIARSTTETTMQVHSPDGSVVPMRSVTTTEVLP
jgi:hypothetical protein